MRRVAITVLAVALSVSMAGCSVQISAPAKDTTSEAEPVEVEKSSEEPVISENDADEHFMAYLSGEEADESGELFWAVGEDIEYALYDLNGDGQNELLVHSFETWIPDIIEYRDGKIVFSRVDNIGSSSNTFINDRNQFVCADTGHQGRDYYIISEINGQDDAKVVFALVRYYDDWAASGSPEYYKKEMPTEEDFQNENFDPISEEEFDSLVKEYTNPNTSIKWEKQAGNSGNPVENTEENSSSSDKQPGDAEKEQIIKAYDDYMKEYFDNSIGDVKISMLYLNDDDIPEAIIEQEGDITWYILTIDNGKAVNIAGTDGSLNYVPKGNKFYYEWSDGESSGTVCMAMKGSNVSFWMIDEKYTDQGTEYVYSDDNTDSKTITEAEAGKYYDDARKDCIPFDGEFFSNAGDALRQVNS